MILGDVSFSIKPTDQALRKDSLFLCFRQRSVLLSQQEGIPFLPTYEMVAPLLPKDVSPFELAHTDTQEVFVPDPLTEATIPEGNGLTYQSLRAFHSMPFAQGAILTSAWHLWSWYQKNRYCGACGGVMRHLEGERALCCQSCDEPSFPMIAPAVIVAVTCEDSILLARNVQSEWNHYALIAGYVEVGETLEHAIRREIMEEVGLRVHSLRYLGNQPWGISGSLMFAFHAQGDQNEPLQLQESEIADAKWVRRDELEPNARPVSIAFELIERFRQGVL